MSVNILTLDEETLRNYVKRYQSGGINALITDHYLGSFSKLSTIQLQKLEAHLEQNTYLTVDAVIAHVEEVYEVLYSVSGMTDLLHRLKFTYKKSKLVPAKADKEKQEQFLKQLTVLRRIKAQTTLFCIWMGCIHNITPCWPMAGLRKGKTTLSKVIPDVSASISMAHWMQIHTL